ncbi:hypothetical protein JKF63_06121 [Porcisia hertigi]|uniref:Uncharacterized protein n=1 Tax=Porcisia hertigi TaxID=2761500 RepID=A0A836I0G3_9TRYP|nr:hypothetical protein JKF63_06121 [Porcisia hertigi]
MKDFSRPRGVCFDAESSSTGPSPPAASPLGSFIPSSERTRYPHPTLRSLELVLPTSLWPDSYLQERARYTLLPRHSLQLSNRSTVTTPVSSPSSVCDKTPRTTATMTTCVGEQQHRTSAVDVDGHPPEHALGMWSFITIYRNFKRAREAPDVSEHQAKAPCRADVSVMVSLPPTTSLAEGCDPDNYSEETSLHGNGPSSSSCCSSTPSRAESIGTPVWHPRPDATAPGVVSTQNTIAREFRVPRPASPETAAVAAVPHTSAHTGALRLFKTLLDCVSVAHETRCPLCSPQRPPRWGRCAQPKLPKRSLPALSDTARAGDVTLLSTGRSDDMVGDVHEAHELASDEEKQAALEVYRQRLLGRARSLLNRHSDRLNHLRETKPSLFKDSVELHPLVCACAKIGGLPLLRALSATL